MTKLNIKEVDLVANVRTISKGLIKEEIKKEDSKILFFGGIDIPMQEIDAAIRKLEMLSATKMEHINEEE